MDEADAALGRFRQHVLRKAREEIGRRVERVNHDVFGRAGMGILSLKMGGRGACAPGLVADLTQLFAVNRVSEQRAEAFDVELVYAAADFFVGRKGDGERAVLDLRVAAQDVN